MAAVDRRRSSLLEKDWVDFASLDSIFNTSEALSQTAKIAHITAACAAHDRPALVLLARRPGGLLCNQARAELWPILLGAAPTPTPSDAPARLLGDTAPTPLVAQLDTNDLPPHRDEDQIRLDINRLFSAVLHFHMFHQVLTSLYTTILSPDDVLALRKRLFCLMVRVLRSHPCLNYYQGYHDVASVVLMVCNDAKDGDERAFRLLEKLTLCHLRDFMIADIGLSINHLKLIPLLVEAADPQFFELIRHTSNSYIVSKGTYFDYKFFQALLSILTLYSHDIANFTQLSAVWDFVLSYNSVAASLYVYVAALLQFKDNILRELDLLDDDAALVDPDLVHSVLSPANLLSSLSDTDLDEILSRALALIDKYPPNSLPNAVTTFDVWFGEYNRDSVLMTTSKINSEPSESDAKDLAELISKQETQQREEALHEAVLFQRALEEELMATLHSSLYDVYSGKAQLLSSSLSSLTAASSEISTSVARKSSALFKLVFHVTDDEPDDESKQIRRTIVNLYTLSFTVGCTGFLMHFLLKQADVRISFRGMQPRSTGSVALFNHNVHELRSYFLLGISNAVGSAFTYIRDSDMVTQGIDMAQVGLGTLRNSVYAIGSFH